jgi:hypothetical protein
MFARPFGFGTPAGMGQTGWYVNNGGIGLASPDPTINPIRLSHSNPVFGANISPNSKVF